MQKEQAYFDYETLVQTLDALHSKALQYASPADDPTLIKMEQLAYALFGPQSPD